MQLNEIRDNKGARPAAMRIGRGIGSGKGKTGGRGVKGQKSRSGVSIKGFEGGQMPIYQRLPKRGFNMHAPKKWVIVNLGRIQQAADDGRIDLNNPITRKELQLSGLVSGREGNLRLLGKGVLTAKLNITVTVASKSAIAMVEKLGGSVTIVEATPSVTLTKEEIKAQLQNKASKASKPQNRAPTKVTSATNAKADVKETIEAPIKKVAVAKAAPKAASPKKETATKAPAKKPAVKKETVKKETVKKETVKKTATKKTTDE
ncbi:MAG: 50S ribosomal protein L15 [Alphaproteobacteria bacterium]|nr:50S ribosomal protein L15 [Alphaproteobacteria bacterium]